ncbi:MAG: hydrogenase expression/formation protein HypE [Pirellulaceae bacterium]|nr:hydrogenase expression/formation protein HypE [Planctomycetales bacterium]
MNASFDDQKHSNPDQDSPRSVRFSSTGKVSISGPLCPTPLRDYPHIILGHGGGGRLSSELIEHIFVPAFGNDALRTLADASVFPVHRGRLAMSTDSFVVRPLFFPGGNIGDLAVNGTINDLAMSGAVPHVLSVAFILEEGLAITELIAIVGSMAEAARRANVSIITGDTKVVDRGHGDGCYINTTGIGIVADGVDIAPSRAEPGDAIIVSGTVGDHGMAVMSVREGLEFESPIVSDTAALYPLVALILDATDDLHVLRDPTRGGLATTLNEIAVASSVGMMLDETAIPVSPTVASACELLGFDPFLVANEGKLVCIVPGPEAGTVVRQLRSHPLGAQAAVIGHCVADHPRTVVARTAIGASRVIAVPIGEQLPRIC